jgi:hypothetical protein
MTIRRPAAMVTIDGRELTLAESATVAMSVVITTTGAHDTVALTLGPGSPALDIAPDARVEAALGEVGSERLVFTGKVSAVAHQPWGTEVHALASTAALNDVRVGKSYVGRSVGDIVRDLAATAGVDAGDVDSGPTLPVFYVDESRSLWHHIRHLTDLVAVEVTSAPEGGLNARPPRSGVAGHTLRAGAELLSWSVGRQRSLSAAAAVGPYSAASEQGSEAWSLIHHDPGGSGTHRVHPLLRDREIAQVVDRATTSARSRVSCDGWAIVVGDESIRAGDLVELDAVDRAEATYRVITVRHDIDLSGFRSALRLEGVAA